ncbi:Hypothetical protein ORPV_1088 [Orpheovirus IHUMI-LCC2]|uniref:Uncharacterized protein n=1 Tax=Orpheovirus IHUMI-LCC2 TaxID=2023057 RepID=A0A2I2L620_9VIRU|nr:Hypothetical protein ORPV_1088 [Orpheovirus IHUMI-LCC2]SNW62992.1 Hypothetical protein ORPV_1088 [Orpheovirus IHUMI-LCC2]
MNNIVETIDSLSSSIIDRLKSDNNTVTIQKKLYSEGNYIVYIINIFTVKDFYIKGKVIFTHYNLGYDGNKITFYKTHPIYISNPRNVDYMKLSEPLPIIGYHGMFSLSVNEEPQSLYNKLSDMI